LALDKDIPESGTRDEHRVGHCIFKDQIKRVLLYQVYGKKDKGVSAKLLLDECLRDNEVWYEQMGKNLRPIEDLAVSAEFEDDVDFQGSGYVYKCNYIQMICKINIHQRGEWRLYIEY